MSDSKRTRSLEKSITNQHYVQQGRSRTSKIKMAPSENQRSLVSSRTRSKDPSQQIHNSARSGEKQRTNNRYQSNLNLTSEETVQKKAQRQSPVQAQVPISQQQYPLPVPVSVPQVPTQSSAAKQQASISKAPSATNPFDIDPKTQAVFDKKNYRILEKLKQGSFGQVFKGEYVVDHTLVAIKVMDFRKLSQMFRRKYIPRELKALIECRHQNTIQIYDIIRCNNNLFIFMEFCSNGDLASYIKKHGACTENLARVWFRQLVDALLHVHREIRMAHRDIKLDNVLLDERYNTKLTDFGFAKDSWNEEKHRVELAQTICGTEPYMCPQLIQRLTYNPYLADVWAMGVVLYCFLVGRFPFTWNDTNIMIIEQLNYPKFLLSIFSNRISEEAVDLTVKMLNPDERRRMTLHEAWEHPWLKRPVNASPRTLIWRSSRNN